MSTLALCIPAYNAAVYLPGLLTSAGQQDIPFDEILVYDDGSADDTAIVAESFGARVIRGGTNKGCSFGKNVMAYSATSEWLHFHDADDDLLPNFSREIHKWIRLNRDYEVLLLNFNYIDRESGTLLGAANHQAEALRQDAIRYTINHKIVNFGVYQRQSFLKAGGFDLDPDVLYNEDNALHQRLALGGLKFDFLPAVTCVNYRYDKSMSVQNRQACARANYHVIKKTADKLPGRYPDDLAAQLWNSMTILASFQDWAYVKKAYSLLTEICPGFKADGAGSFVRLSKVNLYFAVWLREMMIRRFKPSLRKRD